LNARRLRFAVQDWIAAQSAETKLRKRYLLTFTFEHLADSENAVRRQMECELERCYGTLLTWVARDPRSPSRRDELPRLFAFPDQPVPKRKMSALQNVQINDWLHYHAALLPPWRSLLQAGLKKHVREN
jgi:hypothetical protein